MKFSKIPLAISIILIFTFSLSGCVNNPSTQPRPTSTDIVETISLETSTPPQPAATETIESSKNIFILLTNSDLYFPDQTVLTQLTSTLTELGYEVLSAGETPDTGQSFSHVLLFGPTQETISHFQSDNFERLLIVQESAGLSTGKPTTILKMRIADRLFIAGYLSAILSNDWRVGGLLPAIEYQNTSAEKIFQNGVEFMCGRCSPTFGPIVNFPVTTTLSSPEDNEGTLQAFSEISPNKINILYIPSAYLFDDLVILLHQSGITIVSDSVPGQDRSDWIDYAIVDDLSNLILESISESEQNEDLQIVPISYSVEAITAELSPGKNNFITLMINDLQKGFISPYQAPAE